MGQQASSQNEENGPDNPETVWWCRLLSRIIGCVAGLVCIICAVIRLISTSALCIVSGILMLFIGFIVLVFEAPICCQFVDITKPIGIWAEKRSYFQKGFLYAGSAIIPFAMCVTLPTIFGCGAVFAAGVFYGLMALGRKADREQMMANAQNIETGNTQGVRSESMSADLVNNEQKLPTNDNPFSQYK